MSWEIRDRYLWLGFGAFLFVAVRAISHTLRTTIRLSEVYDPDHAKAANDIQAEDSISLEALATLVTSPNQDISTSATSLILSRFAQDQSACINLTTDLFSPSTSTRQKAKQVLFLFDSLSLDFYPFDDASVSDLHDRSDRRIQHACQAYFFATRKYRQGRLNSLVGIADMVEESMRAGQRVHRVRRSAAETHFVFPEHEHEHENENGGEDDGLVAARFHPVSQRVESLVDMLAEQAVTTRPMMRFPSDGEASPTASSTTSELSALEEVDPGEDAAVIARLRHHAQSNHEAEARRRRREAMVLHEGGGRIGMEDIHHPRTNGRS